MKTFLFLLLPLFLQAQTDQTDYLQKLINSGNNVTIPPGIYFTKQLCLHSGLTLHGTGVKLRMIQGDYDNIMINLYKIANVHITGLELALNGIQGNIWDGTAAVTIFGCNNVVIDSCFIHDNTYIAIRLTGNNRNIKILHNFIQNTDTGVHCNNLNKNVDIIGNTVDGGTSEGITVYGYNAAAQPFKFNIDSNIITNKKGSFGINLPYAKEVSITHNTITNCLGGVLMHDTVSNQVDTLYTSSVSVVSNLISNTTYGIMYVGDSCKINNNTIQNVQWDAIQVGYDKKTVTGVNIRKNTILNTAIIGGGTAAIKIKNTYKANISENAVRSRSFLNVSGEAKGLLIQNNN